MEMLDTGILGICPYKQRLFHKNTLFYPPLTVVPALEDVKGLGYRPHPEKPES